MNIQAFEKEFNGGRVLSFTPCYGKPELLKAVAFTNLKEGCVVFMDKANAKKKPKSIEPDLTKDGKLVFRMCF